MRRIAIGQAGGPTVVINSTLVGLVKQLKDEYELRFIEDGFEGLVDEKYKVDHEETIDWIIQQEDRAGACLGSGRYHMTAEDIHAVIQFLKRENISTLIFIGGNGTMEALYKIHLEAEKQDYDLQIIGLPKTVDNDLYHTDHAPGFGSSAKYVAHSTRDLSYDLQSMKNFEQVRIIETMGRNAGWLAAASGYLKKKEFEGPHYIALPERKLCEKGLTRAVKNAVDQFGYAVVVVSEGVQWQNGSQIERAVVNGRTVLGGISDEIADYLRGKLHLTVRAESLGINQRCATSLVSSIDKKEAYLVGEVGAKWVGQNLNNVVATIQRTSEENYNVEIKPVPIKDVANSGERLMPDEFIDNLDKYYEWLSPLIEDIE